ncbi:ceramide kinase-like protein [Babylonia areolata]|uniref:ceramide kinase-like protein n=1 Tax=Babylonia areolata TaxID=304850 RepID=UPI003FD26CB5
MAEEAQSTPAVEPVMPATKTSTAEPGSDAVTAKSNTAQEAASDSVDASVLASGEVNYNGRGHQLFLLQKGLRLVASQPDSKGGAESPNVPVVDVPWREVVCACEPPVKKSKSIPAKKTEAGDPPSPSNMFAVHYMIRNAKTQKVQCKSVTLESTPEAVQSWILQIEEKRKEGKPQKLLIIINPIGGKGTARQMFAKRVQPLFALAGVELVVKVTERFQHAIEIAKTFDVTSVDGVVVVGGDGLYVEVLHGLVLRRQEEEGVDFNDPDATLVPPSVRLGVIPGGTGNGASKLFNGVIDVDTATLNIIRGEMDWCNMFAIHEAQKLAHYCGLFYASGIFSSLMKRSEELRWMKRARYAYIMLPLAFKKSKVMEFDMEVLKNEPDPSNEGEAAGAEAASSSASSSASSGWIKLGRKQMTVAMSMVARMTDCAEDLFETNPFRPGCDLMLMNSGSTLDVFRFLYTFYTHKKSGLEKPYIELVRNIRGVRFQLVQPSTEGATGSGQQTEVVELAKMLDVDGELVTVSEPKFEIRLHNRFFPVFAYTDHFVKESSPPKDC